MKKILITTILVASLFLVGCGKEETEVSIADIDAYTEITYNQLQTKIDNEEDFILYIGSATCSHCQSYTITLKSIVKRYPDLEISYIDTSKLTPESNLSLKAKFPYEGTPTTLFVSGGEELDRTNRLNGNRPYEKIIEKFRNENYID